MAFKPLPIAQRGLPSKAHDEVTVGVVKPAAGRPVTIFSIPSRVLAEAGLSTEPGVKFDISVGDGADLGSVCIQTGSRHTLGRVGGSKTRLAVRCTGLASGPLRTKRVTYELGIRALVIRLPAGFPWNASMLVDVAAPAATNEQRRSIGIGAAA